MNKVITYNILRFIILVLLQGLVLINVNLLHGLSLPFLYVFFILMLPIKTGSQMVLILSFFIGLAVDIFYNTPGIHASASVLMAYARGYLIVAIAPRNSYEVNDKPTIYSMGLSWYLKYAIILVLLHHLALFILDSFGSIDIWLVIKKTVLSSIFTITLLVITQYLTSKSTSS